MAVKDTIATSTHFSWNVSRDSKIGMIPEAREVRLRRNDRKVLEARCRSPVTLQRDLKRARIVLLAADGRSTRSIAREVGVQPRIVSRFPFPSRAGDRDRSCAPARASWSADDDRAPLSPSVSSASSRDAARPCTPRQPTGLATFASRRRENLDVAGRGGGEDPPLNRR
jgi:Homeodomain-like domain